MADGTGVHVRLSAWVETWSEHYRRLRISRGGNWLALSAEGRVTTVVDTDRGSWKKIHEKVGNNRIKVTIGYSPRKEERKAASLFC